MEATAFITADIVYNILLKLPVKSLLRFRCVCKNWLNIIDGLSFAIMHESIHAADVDEPQILSELSPEAMHSLIYDGNVIKKSEYPVLEFSKESLQYIFCNAAYGLLCFRNRSRFGDVFLWNPLRGEILELPRPQELNLNLERYGVGFDSEINKYKIIRLATKKIDGVFAFKSFAEIYTLGTNSWRAISSSSLPSFFSASGGISAYGDMHWLHYKSKQIISFDFRKEEFNCITLEFEYGTVSSSKLINLRGYLGIVTFESYRHFDIWVMKDYESKEWVREFRIGTQVWAREANNIVAIPDICFLRDSVFYKGARGSHGLIFQASSPNHMYVLDLNTNRNRYMQCPYCDREGEFGRRKIFRRIFSYTGSVLSFRNFGNLIAEDCHKINFLKSACRVYVSPIINRDDAIMD